MDSHNFVIEAEVIPADDVGFSLTNVLHKPMEIVYDKLTLFFAQLLGDILKLLFGYFAHNWLETFQILRQSWFILTPDWPNSHEIF